MNFIKNFLIKLYKRIKNVAYDIYHGGIGQLISKRRWLKALLDMFLIASYFYAVIYYGSTMAIALISVGLIMTIFNKITAIEEGFIVVDLTKPFLTIAAFSFVSVLYSFVRETALVCSVFLIPVMTRQIEERISKYYNELTPSEV